MKPKSINRKSKMETVTHNYIRELALLWILKFCRKFSSRNRKEKVVLISQQFFKILGRKFLVVGCLFMFNRKKNPLPFLPRISLSPHASKIEIPFIHPDFRGNFNLSIIFWVVFHGKLHC